METESTVKFISRYRDETDFSVNGRRVRVNDRGLTDATDAERKILFFHWLDTYADFLVWFHKARTWNEKLENYPFDPKFYLT